MSLCPAEGPMLGVWLAVLGQVDTNVCTVVEGLPRDEGPGTFFSMMDP